MKPFKPRTLTLLSCLILSAMLPLFVGAQVRFQMQGQKKDVAQWIDSRFAKGQLPPFSFVYGEVPSAEFIRTWKYTAARIENNDPQVIERLYTYHDAATHLVVECQVKGYKDFNAVEWVLRFRNESKVDSKQISMVKVADVDMQSLSSGEFMLHYAEGNKISKSDYHPRTDTLRTGHLNKIMPQGGRSSEYAFPFFNIEFPASQGVMIAIGWTGTWFANITKNNTNSLSLESGMADMNLYLYPQEQIRTPSISMLFWQGTDRMVGHNQFRRYVLAHHSRKIDGKIAEYPLCSGFNYRDPVPCTEYSCITADWAVAMINRYAQFELVPDVFWLDAGWHTGSFDYQNGKSWANTAGNWTIDTLRFPDGLKPVADAAHKKGAKFMAWFEPERVIKGTQWAVEHPEWMLDLPSEPDGTYLLFDLGNRQACDWLCEYIGDMMEDNNIDHYRQDFNMQPAAYWKAHDLRGREGMKEIRHVEGLYAFWDYLLTRFPNMLIDNCASGGKRVDLETISRSAPLWRSDYYHYDDPDGYQCHTYGLNYFLPVHGTGILQTDKYSFRSSMSSALIYNWKITEPGVSFVDMQNRIKEFRDIRNYYYEDYYPLTGTDDLTGDNVWLAYQMHRPTDQSGIVVAFRRGSSPDPTITVRLSNLSPLAVYTLTDADTGTSIAKTGKQLSDGFALTIDQPRGSLLLKYKIEKPIKN